MALSNEVKSTYGTYLMKYDKTQTKWVKLVDIVDYSDIEEQPDTLDTTTLSDDTETSIPSIKRLGGGISFTINLKPSDFKDLRSKSEAADKGLAEYAIWFKQEAYDEAAFQDGATGVDDQFAVYFYATYTVVQNGAGVDEVLRATLTIYPQKHPSSNKVVNYDRPNPRVA